MVLGPHFAKVCCANHLVDWPELYEVRQRDVMQEIGQTISWGGLNAAVPKFTNNKATGLKKSLTNAFKGTNNENLTHLLDFFNKYWLEETDFDECHKGQIVPVPKSGDLSDPIKWRGVNLVYIGAKIFSSILCGRAFNTIKSYGVKYQFGYTPEVGCQY